MGRKEPLLESRIKDSADPAGLSPPLVLLRELISLLLATSSPILRASLLTVTKEFSRTTDATVVSWITPSNMLRQLLLLRKPITRTLQRHRHATPTHLPMPHSRSAH